MAVNWFDILLYTVEPWISKLGDKAIDDISNVAEELNDTFGYEEPEEGSYYGRNNKTAILSAWLKERGLMQMGVLDRIQKYMRLKPEYDKAAAEAYRVISDVNIDRSQTARYADQFEKIIASNGRFLSAHPPKEIDTSNVSRDLQQNFFNGVAHIKRLPDSLRDIKHLYIFITQTGLDKISYYDIKGKTPKVSNYLAIIPSVIEGAFSLEERPKDNTDLFKIFINDDIKDDKSLLEALSKEDVKSQMSSFDMQKLQMALEKVNSVYPSDDMLVNRLDELLDIKTNNDEVKTILQSSSEVTLGDVIAAASSPEDFGLSDSTSIRKISAHALSYAENILNTMQTQIFNIENNIVETEKILKDDFYINKSLVISFPTCIDKWKSFIESDLYRSDLFGKPLDDEMKRKAAGIYNNAKENFSKFLDKEATNIIKVIKDIDINSVKMEDVLWAVKFNKIRPGALEMSSARLYLLKFLKMFFQRPFDEKGNVKMANVTKNKYFDAACVVIYYKNNKIDEALEIINSMMFEGYAIFEETSFLNYFKNLYNDIKDYINSHKGGNIFTYIRDRKDDFNMAGDGTPDEKEEQLKQKDEEAKEKDVQIEELTRNKEELEKQLAAAASDKEEIKKLTDKLSQVSDEIEKMKISSEKGVNVTVNLKEQPKPKKTRKPAAPASTTPTNVKETPKKNPETEENSDK